MPMIDHIGNLPGSGDGSFKSWVCSLEDEFEMMMKKMDMDDFDIGGGDMGGMGNDTEWKPPSECMDEDIMCKLHVCTCLHKEVLD